MNIEQARHNMIEQQLRPWNVRDAAALEVLSIVRREEFVPRSLRALAWADAELPLGHGATMLAPKIEAHALQALALRKHEKVLEIGTGSGFMAALLAAHADTVWSVEIEPELAAMARANLHRQSCENVVVENADGAHGLPAHAPYDAIMVSGGVAAVPREILAQLKVGGRLFAIVGATPAMTAQLIVRMTEDGYRTRGLFETVAAPLRNVAAAPRFVF